MFEHRNADPVWAVKRPTLNVTMRCASKSLAVPGSPYTPVVRFNHSRNVS